MSEFVGCLKKYACFSGRARRKEYWMFVLVSIIISSVVGFFEGLFGIPQVLSAIVSIGLLLPGWSVFARRMHDTGRSGWWWLILLLPIVGAIVLLVFECQDSQPGENKYGPNPKGF